MRCNRRFNPEVLRLDTLALPGPLGLHLWSIPQSYITVTDGNGTVTSVSGGQQLINTITGIKDSGGTIKNIFIKGHGGSDGDAGVIQLSDSDPTDTLTSVATGGLIMIDNQDVTNLLQSTTNASTTITLTGCNTGILSMGVSKTLPPVDVYGTIRSIIGIPFSPWIIGSLHEFRGGAPMISQL